MSLLVERLESMQRSRDDLLGRKHSEPHGLDAGVRGLTCWSVGGRIRWGGGENCTGRVALCFMYGRRQEHAYSQVSLVEHERYMCFVNDMNSKNPCSGLRSPRDPRCSLAFASSCVALSLQTEARRDVYK